MKAFVGMYNNDHDFSNLYINLNTQMFLDLEQEVWAHSQPDQMSCGGGEGELDLGT